MGCCNHWYWPGLGVGENVSPVSVGVARRAIDGAAVEEIYEIPNQRSPVCPGVPMAGRGRPVWPREAFRHDAPEQLRSSCSQLDMYRFVC